MQRSGGQAAVKGHSMRVQPCGPESARQFGAALRPAMKRSREKLVVAPEVEAPSGLDSINGVPTLQPPQRAPVLRPRTTAARHQQSYSRRTSMKRLALFAAVVLAVAACAKSDEKAADTTPAAMAPAPAPAMADSMKMADSIKKADSMKKADSVANAMSQKGGTKGPTKGGTKKKP